MPGRPARTFGILPSRLHQSVPGEAHENGVQGTRRETCPLTETIAIVPPIRIGQEACGYLQGLLRGTAVAFCGFHIYICRHNSTCLSRAPRQQHCAHGRAVPPLDPERKRQQMVRARLYMGEVYSF